MRQWVSCRSPAVGRGVGREEGEINNVPRPVDWKGSTQKQMESMTLGSLPAVLLGGAGGDLDHFGGKKGVGR